MNSSDPFFTSSRLHDGHTAATTRPVSRSSLEERCRTLLRPADILINGGRAWDIQVHNRAFFSRVLSEGSLGFGESYMDGWWDCEALDQLFFRIFRAGLDQKVLTWRDRLTALQAAFVNYQSLPRAFRIGRHHYDLGNDLYRLMLDERMIYSCGYWKEAATLDQAQEAKLELICRKLGLQSAMRLLDIGCGWGGLAAYAAERYGVTVTGITVSGEQARLARHRCRNLPVTIELQDYRQVQGRFDRIVSIGMFEHVGHQNYRTFMSCQKRLLSDDGLVLLHTIGRNRTGTTVDKWIARYIFPNSMLPSARQIAEATEGLFVIEDWHNFGIDYDTTLLHWFANFDRTYHKLRGGRYDRRFYRMWKYYLLSCAGSFRARRNQVWQVVLSPSGCPGGYQALR